MDAPTVYVDYQFDKEALVNILRAIEDAPVAVPGMCLSYILAVIWMSKISPENYSLARGIMPRFKEFVYNEVDKAELVWMMADKFTEGECDRFVKW